MSLVYEGFSYWDGSLGNIMNVTKHLSLTDGDAAHPCAVQGSFCAVAGPMRDGDTLNVVSHCLGPCMYLTVHTTEPEIKIKWFIWYMTWLVTTCLLPIVMCRLWTIYVNLFYFAVLCWFMLPTRDDLWGNLLITCWRSSDVGNGSISTFFLVHWLLMLFIDAS